MFLGTGRKTQAGSIRNKTQNKSERVGLVLGLGSLGGESGKDDHKNQIIDEVDTVAEGDLRTYCLMMRTIADDEKGNQFMRASSCRQLLIKAAFSCRFWSQDPLLICIFYVELIAFSFSRFIFHSFSDGREGAERIPLLMRKRESILCAAWIREVICCTQTGQFEENHSFLPILLHRLNCHCFHQNPNCTCTSWSFDSFLSS